MELILNLPNYNSLDCAILGSTAPCVIRCSAHLCDARFTVNEMISTRDEYYTTCVQLIHAYVLCSIRVCSKVIHSTSVYDE